MELYSRLQEKLVQVTASCEVLTKDPKTKKYKFDLQKAISTPINAISGQSGEHLMDKIRRLDSVLSGKRVQVTGRQVSAGDHPQGRAYCFYLLSQKIVVSLCIYPHTYVCGWVFLFLTRNKVMSRSRRNPTPHSLSPW